MSTIMMDCSCDAFVAKICEVLNGNVLNAAKAGTSDADVWIVGFICSTIVFVALIARWAILGWKEKEIKAKNEEQKEKASKEEKDCQRKLQSELLDKYLTLIKEHKAQTKDNSKSQSSDNIIQGIKDCICPGKQETPAIDMSGFNQYREVLEYLIELSQKNELNKISKDTLKSFFNS